MLKYGPRELEVLQDEVLLNRTIAAEVAEQLGIISEIGVQELVSKERVPVNSTVSLPLAPTGHGMARLVGAERGPAPYELLPCMEKDQLWPPVSMGSVTERREGVS